MSALHAYEAGRPGGRGLRLTIGGDGGRQAVRLLRGQYRHLRRSGADAWIARSAIYNALFVARYYRVEIEMTERSAACP